MGAVGFVMGARGGKYEIYFFLFILIEIERLRERENCTHTHKKINIIIRKHLFFVLFRFEW